jgi:hypothetical protein
MTARSCYVRMCILHRTSIRQEIVRAPGGIHYRAGAPTYFLLLSFRIVNATGTMFAENYALPRPRTGPTLVDQHAP